VTIIRFGIVATDVYAREGFAEEWMYALDQMIELMKTRYQEFGEETIAVMTTLSKYKPCFLRMKEAGFVEYFQRLQQLEKFQGFARFFLANATRHGS